MRTKKAIIIILAAIAASVLILESGVYSLKLDDRGGGWGSSVTYNDIDAKSAKGGSFVETGAGYRVSVLNSRGEEKTADVVIDIDEMSIDGDYWFPLYKTMDCRYSGSAECTDNLIKIEFDGHFDDFTVIGLCSPFAARRLARQKAMEEIKGIVEHGLDLVTTPVQQAPSAQGIPVSW